jgi:ParB family chromosome partitioning protein
MKNVSAAESLPMSFRAVPLALIKPSSYQARSQFDPAALESLAESMKQEGQLQPVVVRPQGPAFELISGERRFRAASLLGWETIEAKVLETASEAEAAAKGLVENLQRENLNPIDEATGFRDLKSLNDAHWTQERIGQVCGKTQDYVSRSLALLNLPEAVLKSMRQRILTREHGVELLRLNDAKLQKSYARKIIKGEWSVKKTRGAVTHQLDKLKGLKPKLPPRDPLEHIWPNLLSNASLVPGGAWNVEYGPPPVKGGKKAEIAGWNLFITTPGTAPKAELVDFLTKLAEALKGSPITVSPPLPVLQKNEPQKPRLPQNADEQQDLEAMAQAGPGAVYAWIWGADSLMARTMAKMTWKEIGAPDPVTGCRNIVLVLRQMERF